MNLTKSWSLRETPTADEEGHDHSNRLFVGALLESDLGWF
jgi:hypothetical protein